MEGAAPIAYTRPSSAPTYTVPSLPIAGDERTGVPIPTAATTCVGGAPVPLSRRKYTLPSFEPTTTMRSCTDGAEDGQGAGASSSLLTATAGEDTIDPPVANCHARAPVHLSTAYNVPSSEPKYR